MQNIDKNGIQPCSHIQKLVYCYEFQCLNKQLSPVGSYAAAAAESFPFRATKDA